MTDGNYYTIEMPLIDGDGNLAKEVHFKSGGGSGSGGVVDLSGYVRRPSPKGEDSWMVYNDAKKQWAVATTDLIDTNSTVIFRDKNGRFKETKNLPPLGNQLEVNRYLAELFDDVYETLDAIQEKGYDDTQIKADIEQEVQDRIDGDKALQDQIDDLAELHKGPEAPELPEDRLPIFAEDEPTEYPYAEDGESTGLQVDDQWYQVTDPDFDYDKPDPEGLDLYIWTKVDGDFEWVLFEPEEEIEYATLEHSDGRDNALQLQIDELEQEIDIIAPRLDGAQYKYVGAPSVKPGEMHIASGSFTRADDLVFFNDTALDGTTHAWGSLHEGDYLEITDTQEKDSRTAENYAMYLVTKEPEGTGMKQIEVSLVKGSGAPAVDDILDAKGFKLGGNDINDLDARYIKLGGESEPTDSIVVKTAAGKSHNFGLHSQEGSTAFWIKNKANNYIFSVQNDGRLIAGPESTPFIATKANHLTTKSYVDSQLQASSGTTHTFHSGWNKKFKFIKVNKSLSEQEYSLNYREHYATIFYIFKAYNQAGASTRILDYNGTPDAMLEIYEWDPATPKIVLRAGIGEITQSPESVHDSQIALGRIWALPDYIFSEYSYYSFVMRGLVSRPYPTTSAVPADKLIEDDE